MNRLNSDGRGRLLGEFKGENKILQITASGHFKLTGFDISTKFEDDFIILEKWNPKKPISAIYWDGDKEQFNVKRFLVEDTDKKTLFITEHEKSYLELASYDWLPVVNVSFDKRSNDREDELVNIDEFIAVKGLKAIGNRLTTFKVKSIDRMDSLPFEEPEEEPEPEIAPEERLVLEEKGPDPKVSLPSNGGKKESTEPPSQGELF